MVNFSPPNSRVFVPALGFARRLRLGTSWLWGLLRYALRSPASRFLPLTPGFLTKQVVYDLKRGNRFSLNLRDYVDLMFFEQLFVQEDYATHRFLRHYEANDYYREALRQGKTPLILDCGAQAGFAATYFSQTFPGAQIVSIEPVASNVAQARLHNRGRKVDVLQAAIGSEDGKVRLNDIEFGDFAPTVERAHDGAIEMISIPTILGRYSYDKYFPTIVKIDIEGFEDDLFSKNTDWVDEFPLLIIELHDWMLMGSANSQKFLKVIADAGRDFVFYGENVFSFRNPRRPSKRDLESSKA